MHRAAIAVIVAAALSGLGCETTKRIRAIECAEHEFGVFTTKKELRCVAIADDLMYTRIDPHTAKFLRPGDLLTRDSTDWRGARVRP